MTTTEQAQPCPSCSVLAEPEQDGNLTYHECAQCGYTFGFHQQNTTLSAQNTGSCAVGVPEATRRAASEPALRALAANQPGPLLTIGRRADGDNPA